MPKDAVMEAKLQIHADRMIAGIASGVTVLFPTDATNKRSANHRLHFQRAIRTPNLRSTGTCLTGRNMNET